MTIKTKYECGFYIIAFYQNGIYRGSIAYNNYNDFKNKLNRLGVKY